MVRKLLKWLLSAILVAVLLAVFYLAVIIGHPQENPERVEVAQSQPLLTASPAGMLAAPEELPGLLKAFPVPALYAVEGNDLTLTGGISYDAAYGDGFARVLTLTYDAHVGDRQVQVEVQSIYPARALSLVPKGDYHIAESAGQTLAGLPSVRMENGQKIRLHVQGSQGIYVLTVPTMTTQELSAVVRSLQLYTSAE